MPLAEAQAKLVAAHLGGEYAFPPTVAMQADLERERRAVAESGTPSCSRAWRAWSSSRNR
jgi:hypothetical protein